LSGQFEPAHTKLFGRNFLLAVSLSSSAKFFRRVSARDDHPLLKSGAAKGGYPYDVSANPKKKWYAARALFRFVATGKPKRRDRYFDPNSTLLEDRVVLVQATSFEDAIKKANARPRRIPKK
jgi:uncharacterized protein DUF4288